MTRRGTSLICLLTLAIAAWPARAQLASADTTTLPAGFGTLRQDDIALKVQLGALQVRMIPLDESVIRTLSPDSYRTLHELRASKRAAVEGVLRRTAMPGASLWYVQFFNLEPGEARFSPQDVVINSAGRDFRPLDVFALTPGFGEQRLQQREVQAALYVFDPAVEINQPLTITVETQSSTMWETLLKKVDQERALIRNRANAKP